MATKKEKPKPWWESNLLRWGAIVSTIGGILSFIFLIFPQFKPALPPDLDVKISSVAVERDVNYETYLQRQDIPTPEGFTCIELKSDGLLIKPTIELTGLKGKSVQLNWSMYSVDAERLVPPEWYSPNLSLSGPNYTPKLQKDIWVVEHWIPYPKSQGDFFIRLELAVKDGTSMTSLGYADTQPFSVALLPDCAGSPPNAPFPPDLQYPDFQTTP
jgi:hypothetical protein